MKRLLLVVALLALPAVAQRDMGLMHVGRSNAAAAAPAYVQSKSCQTVSSQSTTCTLTAAVTSGHSCVVLAYWDNGTTATSLSGVSETGGSDTFVRITGAGTGGSDANGNVADMWWAASCTAGVTAITVNTGGTGNPTTTAAIVYEISGVTAVDQSNKLFNQLASTTPVGPSLTTTTANEIVIEGVVSCGTAITGIHTGNAFTSDQIIGNGAHYQAGAHYTVTSTGTYNAQWDSGNCRYSSNGASFK